MHVLAVPRTGSCMSLVSRIVMVGCTWNFSDLSLRQAATRLVLGDVTHANVYRYRQVQPEQRGLIHEQLHDR